MHSNKYDYSEIKEYINNSTKYNIICKEHGSFLQRANDHLNGQGCPECGKRNLVGFRRSNYININKDRICTLYVIHCFNNEESFYKLGITSGKINRRYKCSKSMPYNYEVIFNIKGSAEDVWNKEAGLKSKLNSKYIPLIPFGGSLTECYTDLDEIKSYIFYPPYRIKISIC